MTPMARKKKEAPNYAESVSALLAVAGEFQHGPGRIALTEEAVRLADANNDEQLGYFARHELIEAAIFGGVPEVAIVAYAWCLAYFDKHPNPDELDPYNLLWKYKWVVDHSVNYPSIPRGQIEELFEDMKRRYEEAGFGLNAVYKVMREVYRTMGDMKAARAAQALVSKTARDALSDCAACVQHSLMKYYFDVGKPDRAMQMAEPIVEGRMKCAEVPHCTYGHLLLPELFAGRPDVAADYHRRGVKLLRLQSGFLHQASQHLIFLAVTDNLLPAKRYLEKHLLEAVTTNCPGWQFEFANAAAFSLERIAQLPKPPRIKIAPGVVLPEDLDATDPSALRDHFALQARELAILFDERNRTKHFTKRLKETKKLHGRVTPVKV